MNTNTQYFGQKEIVGSAALESVRENARIAIFQQIETMRALSTNVDQWLGFLRGKVIEHWAEYEKDGREDHLWRAKIYRDKLQETLPK